MISDNMERFKQLDAQRSGHLDKARKIAAITIPRLLPPEGWASDQSLPKPYSSTTARAVSSLASKILGVLIPTNDQPYFRFGLKDGADVPTEIRILLDNLERQVYNKLNMTNLREVAFEILEQAIVLGDVLVHETDEFNFFTSRLDEFVVVRDQEGNMIEVLYLQYEPDPEDPVKSGYVSSSGDAYHKQGFLTYYCRVFLNEEKKWEYTKMCAKGVLHEDGIFEVAPVTVVPWKHVSGEHWSRSHCEDLIGDIDALEEFTMMLQQGIAASIWFLLGLKPSSISDIDDIRGRNVGDIVGLMPDDLFPVSPGRELSPQVNTAFNGVQEMRREVGQGFLMGSTSLPTGDRVTAAAVRMIGSELDSVAGGAFSKISKVLLTFAIERTLAVMLKKEEIDPELAEELFGEDPTVEIEVLTGLAALNRDAELTKLLQLGDMVRNLPPEATAMFNWREYAMATITALGHDPNKFVKDAKTLQAEQEQAQAQQLVNQAAQTAVPNLLNQAVEGG
jgi:hypothetical protein